MLRPNLFDYSDAYIVIKRTITVDGTNANNQTDKMLTFKNNTSFRSCVSKISNTFINNAEILEARQMIITH